MPKYLRATPVLLVAIVTFAAACTPPPTGGGTTTTSSTTTTTTTAPPQDVDGDGFTDDVDCDDNDPNVFPGAPDEIDDGNLDSNCDGADGVLTDIVFVKDTGGIDSSTCGDIAEPCDSINQGQARAVSEGRSVVAVAGGTYTKFSVTEGLEVRGGFGQNFKRGLAAQGSTTATVNATFEASVGGPVAILADGITSPTTVADLAVVGTTASVGQNSYGVFVRDSSTDLVLDSLAISGGTGGTGAAGSPGNGGWIGSASSGAATAVAPTTRPRAPQRRR